MDNALTRRHALKLFAGVAMAAVPALGLAQNAWAGITWCRTDPWVVINDIHLNVYPERDVNAPNLCTGRIRLNFIVPQAAVCRLMEADTGFGYGYDINFIRTTTLRDDQYKVEMYVPASDSSMDVRLTCDPVDPTAKTTVKTGTANSWISVITKI